MDRPNDEARLELLIEKHLEFYQGLDWRTRRPKTAAQRQFQDVAWGKAEPITEHERAYVYHLEKMGQSPRVRGIYTRIEDDESAPQGLRSVSYDVGRKWDDAAVNMSNWRTRHR